MLIWRTIIAAWLVQTGWVAAAGLTLARPFGDHMVLPMERPVPVWGTAPAGSMVAVFFGGEPVHGRAGADGKWQAVLPAMPASSKAGILKVACGEENLAVNDVLVGRVYLCSGQSNMDFPLSRAVRGKDELVVAANYTLVRLCNLTAAPTGAQAFDTATLARLNVKDHFTGGWEIASKKSVAEFSAIAWWAGRMIQEEVKIPVGLVENAVGGSETEAWLPLDVLQSRPAYKGLLGEKWLDDEKISSWVKKRAKENLGSNPKGNHPFRPGFLFESGVRAWGPFPFDSVWWYQGETNAERLDDAWNGQILKDLITGWRTALQQPALPFYVIQLPRIGGNDPLRQYWPQYREVQARVAREVPGTHLIVTEDIGWDSPEIHPPDKYPVAKRLAEAVLADQPR